MAGFSLIKMTERGDIMPEIPGGDTVMRCPICGSPAHVLSNRFESDEGSTDVYSVMEMGCKNDSSPMHNNQPCPNYAGPDNANPQIILDTIRNKVN